MTENEKTGPVGELLTTPHLADVLESERFRRFLDQIPIAIVLAELKGEERIVYANPEFERLTGQATAQLDGKPWSILDRHGASDDPARKLGTAIAETNERVGTFRMHHAGGEFAIVDVYSNMIEDDAGVPTFRLAALVDVTAHGPTEREELEQRIREKDTLLREIQHRVKNNLQMITALIRLEARNVPRGDTQRFDRLAGRIESLQYLYDALSTDNPGREIDLGVYLSQIASAVMRSHAVEGIRFNLKVDAYPVSVNVAMPTGLLVNEVLTNALKHAFRGRDGGTVTLHSLADDKGCRVEIFDDGVGLPENVQWPQRGKLSALIAQSLRDNAKADLRIESSPGNGVRVIIVFTRAAAAPEQTAQA